MEGGTILEIAPRVDVTADERIDARGQVVSPGFVDLHAHLREPGGEASETLETGLCAALAGGFTGVCAMPNTRPVNDCPATTLALKEKAGRLGLARLFPIAAVTEGSEGGALIDFKGLVDAGAVAFSDDGRPVRTAALVRRAMEEARALGVPIIEHCEDASLSAGGAMNEGPVAARLGLEGIPGASEAVCLARDLVLAETTGAHLHVAHLSTARALDMVRLAKSRGVRVTCEVTPHHFTLTEEAVARCGSNAKMNPPLRSAEDVEALRKGLGDGTVDAIATDHAPHAADLKEKPLSEAPFGVIGLETALALGISQLVEPGILSLARLIELMSARPAEIINQPLGGITVGGRADLTVFDPAHQWVYRAAEGRSKSCNSPFDGWKLKGRVTATIVAGKVLYRLVC